MDLPCESCNKEGTQFDLDDMFFAVFKVRVCSSCKRLDQYRLVTKTDAKKNYLLTEEELADSSVLPHLSRPNPHSARWHNMQLYLCKQLAAFANAKWGSEQALADARAAMHSTRSSRKIERYAAKVKELRSKTQIEKWQSRRAKKKHVGHQHSYHTISTKDRRVIQECSECHNVIEFEEM
jgi:DNA-repair protein complementing XP-A cells